VPPFFNLSLNRFKLNSKKTKIKKN
jgi:hypothetical protein